LTTTAVLNSVTVGAVLQMSPMLLLLLTTWCVHVCCNCQVEEISVAVPSCRSWHTSRSLTSWNTMIWECSSHTWPAYRGQV